MIGSCAKTTCLCFLIFFKESIFWGELIKSKLSTKFIASNLTISQISSRTTQSTIVSLLLKVLASATSSAWAYAIVLAAKGTHFDFFFFVARQLVFVAFCKFLLLSSSLKPSYIDYPMARVFRSTTTWGCATTWSWWSELTFSVKTVVFMSKGFLQLAQNGNSGSCAYSVLQWEQVIIDSAAISDILL